MSTATIDKTTLTRLDDVLGPAERVHAPGPMYRWPLNFPEDLVRELADLTDEEAAMVLAAAGASLQSSLLEFAGGDVRGLEQVRLECVHRGRPMVVRPDAVTGRFDKHCPTFVVG